MRPASRTTSTGRRTRGSRLPSFDGPFSDYLLDLDAGLRTTIIEGFFAEMKVVLRYNSSPAPGTEKSDVRYLFGVG